MSKLKRLTMATLSASILLTQGGPLPYLAYAVDSVNKAPINGEVNFSWTTADQVTVGSTFNPYEGLKVIDADGDNVAVLATVSGEVDTSRVGVYPITYSIENADGETFSTIRQVEVLAEEVLDVEADISEDLTEQIVITESENQDEIEQEPPVAQEPTEEESSSDEPQSTQEPSKLNDVAWILYNQSKTQELMKFNVNSETGYYEGYINEELKSLLIDVDDETLNQEVLHLRILTATENEKILLTLTVRDLLDGTNALKGLTELNYEIGDQLSLIPILQDSTTLVVTGVTSGDISTEEADYENGVQNEDYLYNVRFQLTEEGLKTIYNEAPIIEGIENVEVQNFEVFDPKDGVTVTDDHDENLVSHLQYVVEQVDEITQKISYQVTDSWGRTTEASRLVIENSNSEALVTPLTDDANDSTTVSTSLADTVINVGGRTYIGDTSSDLGTRFKIQFNTASKEIKLVDQDGRQMNPSYKDSEYFKFELYDKNMNLKASVTLTGVDTSDSEKLNAIKNHIYEIGDYISIWHLKTNEEEDNSEKLTITGSPLIQGDSTVNYEAGIPYKEITEQRYQITENGLSVVTNEAPELKDGVESLSELSLQLNQDIDLIKMLREKLTDDKDNVNKLTIEHSAFTTSASGTYNVTYTVTDSWGATLELTQKITVSSTNTLDNTDFEIYTASNQLAFTMTFNTVNNKIVISKNNDVQLDPTDEGVVFRLKFIRDNITQRTISLKGTDMTAAIVNSKLSGYQFEIGDEIEIWSSYPDNGIKIKGSIKGIPEGGEDYSDGIQNVDAMNNVRFKIMESKVEVTEGEETIETTNNWLQYEYNNAPVFEELEPLVVKRTQVPDYLSGVKVTDEDENIIDKVIYDTLTEEQLNTSGTYEIRYRATDSKGRTTSVVRQVIVQPYSTLETQSILVNVPGSDNLLFELGFDEAVTNASIDAETKTTEDTTQLKKKLVVYEFNPLASSDDDSDDPIIKISLYPESGKAKKELQLTASDLQDKDALDEIENWEFESTDYLYVWSADYEGIYIMSESEEKSGQFPSEDTMTNTRFQLKSEGLEPKYNKAPIFNGLETLYVYKDTNIDDDLLKKNVTVDDEDTSLEFEVEGKENVDSDKIGTYSVSYTVTDSWGRTTQQERQVSVISKAAENTIELFNERDEEMIMFRYNPIKNGFDVTIYPQTTTQNQADNDSSTQFTLSLFNQKHQEVYKLTIDENNWMNEGFFNDLEELEMQHGYYFNISAQDPSKVKINGDIELDDKIPEDTDYASGSVDSDYLTNVRFELTEDGLETVYNEAPTIQFRTKDVFAVLAGDPIDYLNGIQVIDDHDGEISVENIEISYGEEKTENELEIGENTIYYSVTDSWGRETTVARSLTIYNGLAKHEISFYSNPTGDNFGYLNDDDEKYVQIYLEATSENGGIFNVQTVGNQVFNQKLGNSKNFSFTLYENDGTTVKISEISAKGNQTADIFEQLNGQAFEYGDKIKFHAWHPYRLTIDGLIIDQMEDYSDGVDNPLYLTDVLFEITPSGLKSIYTPSTSPNENQNVLIPMSFEGTPLKINFTPDTNGNTGKITVPETSSYSMYYGDGSEVFRLELYRDSRDPYVSLAANGSGNGNNVKNNWATQYPDLNNGGIEYHIGDYIRVWHKVPQNALIFGNVENPHEDYSNGFDSEEDMKYTVFKLTENGLEAVYNEAPQINGVEDKVIILGQTFDPLEGVSVEDDLDGTLEISESNITSEININQLGEQKIIYQISDSWERETTVERTITVRALADFNYFTFYPVDNTVTPSFRLGFDSITKTYQIWDQNQARLDANNTDSEIIKIEIRRVNEDTGEEEIFKTISLTGNDRGTSEQLNDLKGIKYQVGDIVRVYHSSGSEGIEFTNKETEWENGTENPTEEDDFLIKNVGFRIVEEELKVNLVPINDPDSNDSDTVDTPANQTKLEAVYNHAPTINGVSETKEIYKGDSINLLESVSVDDIEDGSIDKSQIKVAVNGIVISSEDSDSATYIFNKVGAYTVTYQVTDSWGRTTLTTQTITVASKVKQNSIDIYDSNNDLAFKITFDTENNQFDLVGPSTNSQPINQLDSSTEPYFKMIVRSMDGETKYEVELTDDETHNYEQLAKIYQQAFELYDTIELNAQSATAVKLSGTVISSSTEYSNGFGTLDKYGQVRFQITEDGLKELTAPTITINPIASEFEIPRATPEFDLEDLVQIGGLAENSTDYQIEVESNINFNVEGDYTITYTVTTSWDTSTTKEIPVKIVPRNELEENKLEIYNNLDEKVLTIGFDTITGRLRVIDFQPRSIDTAITASVLRLTAYDESGNIQKSLSLTGNQVITQDIVDRINQFDYEDIDMLGIWAKYPEKIKIIGNVANEKEDYSDGIQDTDYMNNVRFKATNNGLESVYNEAPVIDISVLGEDKKIYLSKGNTLEMPSGITVKDDHDGTISSAAVSINDSEVDYDTVGEHKIYFEVEDSWGRVAQEEAILVIQPPLENTQIKILPLGNTTKTLVMSFTTDSKITFKEETTTSQIAPITDENGEASITITLYHGSEKGETVTLKSDNMESEITRLLTDEWEFNPGGGDYLAFEGVPESIQQNIQIHGSVDSGKLDYTNGLHDIDLVNTRFRLSDLGIETVYNEAPSIMILPNDDDSDSTTITALKGDVIDFGYNVILSDDHDNLEFSKNVKITYNDDDEVDDIFSAGSLGNNTVTYTVTDSWGRIATTTREIVLENALSEVKIQMYGHHVDDVSENLPDLVLEMTLDQDSMKLKTEIKIDQTQTYYFNKNNNNNTQYKVTLWNFEENGSTTSTELSLSGKTQVTTGNGNNTLKEWVDNGKTFNYGDYLQLQAWHQDKLTIQGPVRNAPEDYSDGVQLGDSYKNVYFKITESGLEAVYKDTYNLADNQNLILLSAREGFSMKIRLSPNENGNGLLSFEDLTSYSIQYDSVSGSRDKGFRLTIYDNNGVKVTNLLWTKNQNPNSGKGQLQTFITELDTYVQAQGQSLLPTNDTNGLTGTYLEGYYMEIAHVTPKYLRIKGNIINAQEDYEDGIDNSEYMENVIFKFTDEGLECIYIEEPEISGVQNFSFENGSTITESDLKVQLLEGVMVNGDIDFASTLEGDNPLGGIDYSSLDYSQTISLREATQEKEYQLNNIGFYDVLYTYGLNESQNTTPFLERVLDNLNEMPKRSTFKRATINVYDIPTIVQISESEKPRVIQAGEYQTKEEAEQWLKTLVNVIDLDDLDAPIDIEIKYNEDNPFDPTVAGEYQITYIATDSGGHESKPFTLTVTVVRTISVSVPHSLPFQVVTNLVAGNEDSPFVAGIMNFTSNTITPVDVYLESVTKVADSGGLELVSPDTFTNWSTISEQDTMSKIALGLYPKDGFEKSTLTKNLPCWLLTDSTTTQPDTYIGQIPAKERGVTDPVVARLTLTAKHGEMFNFGKTSGQFQVSFEFR